jgi:ferredoxin
MECLVIVKIKNHQLYLKAPYGFTLMQCLKSFENNEKIIEYQNNILASCGGNMSCSTCVVKIHNDFINQLNPMTIDEIMFIDIFLDQNNIHGIDGEYRLSCQIILEDNLNGLKIELV